MRKFTFDFNYIGNFIQESGRAGRDGNPAQSILFYSRNDIKTVYAIITGGRERYCKFPFTTNKKNY